MRYGRRQILQGGFALGLGSAFLGGVSWSQQSSPVRAILPSASHNTLAVKILLDRPPSEVPTLSIGGRNVRAERLDRDGYAWGFIQRGLHGGTAYELVLREGGRILREPWTLATLPPLDASPEHFRILFFTCAGGDEQSNFLSLQARRALFDRAISLSPDLAVANGDHIYWDLWTALILRRDPARRATASKLYHRIAWIDEDQAFDSDTNRRSLNTIIARQIAGIYEERFASIPLLFVADDHDYFENDNAGPWGCTFPPRPFTLSLQRRTAAMAYPYALGRPKLGHILQSETVEVVRIGKLLEMNLFDCRRGWTFGPQAQVLFPDVESLLVNRSMQSSAQQFIHVPSNPLGWTAGKLGEWYDDRAEESGAYEEDKQYWQSGWFAQHQRLIKALASRRDRAAVSISGDLHASAAASITRSGDIDLSANPVNTILPGTLGSAGAGFASTARGTAPSYAATLEVVERAPLEERNGFSIVDVFPSRIEVQQFRWRPPEPIAAIATMAPTHHFVIERPA